jgi:hypothetical protein
MFVKKSDALVGSVKTFPCIADFRRDLQNSELQNQNQNCSTMELFEQNAHFPILSQNLYGKCP